MEESKLYPTIGAAGLGPMEAGASSSLGVETEDKVRKKKVSSFGGAEFGFRCVVVGCRGVGLGFSFCYELESGCLLVSGSWMMERR